ncbi:hypothetical protein [Amycolatopsis sp. GA6-003]|uniref:hypothetical protein n=1 Tax=Amycolatopsis sp. GA6-003 TaxID=2652444 RepID=UPI0039176137
MLNYVLPGALVLLLVVVLILKFTVGRPKQPPQAGPGQYPGQQGPGAPYGQQPQGQYPQQHYPPQNPQG